MTWNLLGGLMPQAEENKVSGRGSDVEKEPNEDSKNLSKSWHGSIKRSDSEDSGRGSDVEEDLNEDSKNLSKSWHGSIKRSDSEDSGRGSNVEEDLNEDSLGYEVIEVSDLEEMQIAGFSKQKLLEMCNFCKISYGNNDDRLVGKYQTKAELIYKGYDIIPFYYTKRNQIAGFVFAKGSEVTISYRGTQNFDDIITDASAAFASGFLPKDDGMMHSGFYNAFNDSWTSLDKALNNYAEKQKSEVKDFEFNCTGHSMGGTLANIAALYLKKIKGAEHVCVATFGSPRVFNLRGAEVYEQLLGENTIRAANSSDPIPMFPNGFMGFKHVGKPLKIKTGNFVIYSLGMSIVGGYYHKTDVYYSCIQNIEPEDFQPDDSVSRYYYFSYAVAVPYNIITTALTIPYYLIIAGTNENIEQHCLERAAKSSSGNSIADSGHMLDNALASSRNPLIISYIGCNVNRRDLGLNPLPFTHYDYINRDNVVPRQLKGIKNAPDRNLRIATLGANQGIAKIFKGSNGSLFKLTADNIREISQMLLDNGISETKLSFPDGRIYIFDWNEISRASSISLQKMVKSFTSLSKALEGVSNDRTINADNYRKSLGTESANSKQQKLAENGENGTIGKKVPTQEPTENNNSNKFLTNNREEGKMGNRKKKQDTKSIKERLSAAIQQINYDAVKSIVEQNDANVTKLVLSEALDEAKTRNANLKKGGRKDKKKFDNQSQNIALIIILLQEKLDNIQIDSEPLNNSDRSKVKSKATANGQINTSHAQPIDPEILKLVHNMVETVSDDQTPVGQPEDPSSGKGAEAADDNNNGPNSRVITFENGDEAVIEDIVEEENSGNVSTLESDSDQQDSQPKILVIDDKLHNVDGEGNDTPDNGEPDKTSKNAQKSKFPTIAVSTLLTTAVATETAALAMYFAFQASLLATAIVAGIGVCCLVTALVMHYREPKSSVKNNDVTNVAANSAPAVTVN